jgi:hypothetical protein
MRPCLAYSREKGDPLLAGLERQLSRAAHRAGERGDGEDVAVHLHRLMGSQFR